jgi:hypothetical protein
VTTNHWRIHKGTIAQWTAIIPMPGDPDRLLALTRSILEAAYATEIALIANPDGGVWTVDDLFASIEARYRETGCVGFFDFAKGHMRVLSKVAYWRDGVIVESVVADLKDLLCTLQPEVLDEWVPQHPREPLQIDGHPVNYRDDTELFNAKKLPSISFGLKTTAEIWLPWVRKLNHDQFFDNRELAARHTVRLNAFLAKLASVANDQGGEVRFSNMLDQTWLETLAGPAGIALTGEPPVL